MSEETEQQYNKNLAIMLADERFMAWLEEFDPSWEGEYSGHLFAMHAAWRAGRGE